MRLHRPMGKTLALIGALAVLGVATAVIAQAATSGTGAITRFDGVDEIVNVCTNRTSYGTVPQMTKTFTLGGSGNQGVVAMFQGSLSLDTSGGSFDTGFLRLTIDGVQASPGEVPALSAGTSAETHGFNWQSKALTPGSHTVRVQWRTDLGGTYCADARSLIILHR